MNWILLDDSELGDDGLARLDERHSRHVLDVLKATPGDELRIGRLDGPLGQGEVVDIVESRVVLRCRFDVAAPPRPRVDLVLAMPRPLAFKRLLPQLAALGVDRVVITAAARVERYYFATHWLKPENYQPLLIEGLEQAGDTGLPRVVVARPLRRLVEDQLDDLLSTGRRLIAHPGAAGSLVDAAVQPGERLAIAVGPEGGWLDRELALFQAHGFEAVGMGPRVLRTDTACISLVSLAHALT